MCQGTIMINLYFSLPILFYSVSVFSLLLEVADRAVHDTCGVGGAVCDRGRVTEEWRIQRWGQNFSNFPMKWWILEAFFISQQKKVADCVKVLTLELMLFHRMQVPKKGGSTKLQKFVLYFLQCPQLRGCRILVPPSTCQF